MAPHPSMAMRAAPAWRRAVAGLVSLSLLIALPGALRAEQPALVSLLKNADLRPYPSQTAAPQFSGGTLDGRQLSMTEQRGRVVILNFWASWCLECRSELGMLERLQREFSRGLAIIGINVRESPEAVGRYAKELGLTFPVVFDPDGKINAVYGVIGLPTTFVVARDGRAVAFAVGPRQWESVPLRALIEVLLSEPPSDHPIQ
jgi:thiol-disulfide isomerase/thioredoxin